MPSYVVTGASRGIGLEFVRQLSQHKSNEVFALVRSPQSSDALNGLAKSYANIHVVKADIADVASLQTAADQVSKATAGSLDYLINNAAFITDSLVPSILDYPNDSALEDQLTRSFRVNVVGVAHTINAFLPLLRQGRAKKVISLSTGVAASDFVVAAGFTANPHYSVSKGALNMLVAMYATSLRAEGFTFLAISPGLVNTAVQPPTPEELEAFKVMVGQFKQADPEWDGIPLTPEVSVKAMLATIDKLTVKDSGAFISHNGNQQWL